MRHRGFTLVELTVVIALIGVVATFGASRLMDDRGVQAQRFATDLALRLGTAQRLAMAQRRTVHVVVSAAAGTVRLCLDAGCATPITLSDGSSTLTVPSGIAFSTSGGTLTFNARGQASNASLITFTLTQSDGTPLSTAVTLEPVSGHVQINKG